MAATFTNNTTTWQLSGQLASDEATRQFPVDRTPFSIGRRSDSALAIPSPAVSGRHAEFTIEDSKLRVRDLGSTNGTFVNGVRVDGECEINHGDLVQFAQTVFRVSVDVPVHHSQTVQNDSADSALALIQFDQLINDRAVLPYFQPIVSMAGEPFGYEVLGRSRLFGLTTPHAMFSAASALNLEAELSRIMRVEGIRAGLALPSDRLLFVNTHPVEIDDIDTLVFSLRELRELAGDRSIVLEIHEQTATQSGQMRELRGTLGELQIGLAYDDFGAGQARLIEIAEAPPEYLKFDMQLVQGIGAASLERQKMLKRLVDMTLDMGIIPLAEGIELEEDNQLCEQMGFQCAQGYLHGKPAPAEEFLANTQG